MRARSILFAVFLPLAMAGCEACSDPGLERVAPKIDIADPFDEEFSVCEGPEDSNESFRDCAYSFGDVPVGEGRFFRFLIKNPSPVELEISDIYFSDDSDPAFTIPGEIPSTVPPDSRVEADDFAEVTIRFVPTVANTTIAKLVIVSDAAQLEPDEDVVIELAANGLEVGRPEISVEPAECNFGEVGVTVTAFCDLTINNVGEKDLELNDIGITVDDPSFDGVFGSQTIVPIPSYVAPGTGLSVRLFATPTVVGEATGTLLLGTNDPLNEEVEIPLNVIGAEAPTAVAEVKTINGVPNNNPSPQVKPLDDVVLTGENSVSANLGGNIVAYQW